MKPFTLTPTETRVLGALALFAFVVPNGVFVYFFLTDAHLVHDAMRNPISLVFMAEAFFLMGLFAWLLKKTPAALPGAFTFVLMSILGSLAFSVPATLYLRFRHAPRNEK